MSLDERWYRDVNTFARNTPWLHGVLSQYALWGGLVILALMLAAAYVLARYRERAEQAVAITLCTGVGVVVALLINQHVISPGVGRIRPCHAVPHAEALLSCNSDYSFPSDHCMMAGAFVAGLAFIGARWAIPAGVVAVLLAFTRVYSGVHYPGDVAGGLVIGAVIGVIVVLALRPLAYRLTAWMATNPLRVLVLAHPREPGQHAEAHV
jgi:undecaprenyl-diphosphatase